MHPPPLQKEIIVSRKPSPQTTREAEIISGMRGSQKGTYTSSINPDFINAAQPLDRKTFWKSQQFSYEFRGMDIGDVNGDGLNETVMIDPNNIFIYQKKGNEFKLIQQIPGKSYDNYVSLDVADINGNGIKEIIVSSYTGQQVDSFIIEFRNGKFVTIASGLPWFMRVIDNASGIPLLLGQRRGMDKPFDTPDLRNRMAERRIPGRTEDENPAGPLRLRPDPGQTRIERHGEDHHLERRRLPLRL